jgi:hypothetical protein
MYRQINTRRAESPSSAPTGAPRPGGTHAASISPAQHRRLEARIARLGLPRERVKKWVRQSWGVEHLNEIPARLYSDLDRRLEPWAAQIRAEREGEREAREERAAIRAESGEPIDLADWTVADWLADYDSAEARGEAMRRYRQG